MRRLVIAGVILLSATGCRGREPEDTADSGGINKGTYGTSVPPPPLPFDPARDLVVRWEDGILRAWTQNTYDLGTVRGFSLGMAETGAGEAGWYGEACRDPDQRCHRFQSVGEMSTVALPEEVNNSATLFDAADEGRLTWRFTLDTGISGGRCYVWGHDVGYYASLDCEVLDKRGPSCERSP